MAQAMTALDFALQYLTRACSALERNQNVTLEDIEEALKASTSASGLLKASKTLVEEGAYSTGAKEPQPGTPLNFGE